MWGPPPRSPGKEFQMPHVPNTYLLKPEEVGAKRNLFQLLHTVDIFKVCRLPIPADYLVGYF
jgi:hypothetical protein